MPERQDEIQVSFSYPKAARIVRVIHWYQLALSQFCFSPKPLLRQGHRSTYEEIKKKVIIPHRVGMSPPLSASPFQVSVSSLDVC